MIILRFGLKRSQIRLPYEFAEGGREVAWLSGSRGPG